MDLFHKLKNTVSNALPGNPLLREYEVEDQIASAGPEFLWKIFPAKKKSTKQFASIWVLDKAQLDLHGRAHKEQILEAFRRGVSNLTRIRHPKIISVVAPLEESRDSLAFVTEPVFCSLGNALFMRRNLPFKVQNDLDNLKLDNTEIIYGISNVIQAILFIHKDVTSIHRNISPQSIIITRSGCWKLAGMEFLTNVDDKDTFSYNCLQNNSPASAHPFLKYSAPESVIKDESTYESDMFSFGMAIYSVYNNGKSIIECGDNFFDYKKSCLKLKGLDSNDFLALPETLRKYCILLLSVNSQHRPDPYQIMNLPYFENAGVRALQKMDSLYELDKYGKSEFYKTLPKLISSYSKRINLYKIIPQLFEEFNDPNMIPFVLGSVLLITDSATEEEFTQMILPKLAPVFPMKEPIQITLILLQNLNILLAKFKKADFNTFIFPIISSALETENRTVQDLCLTSLPEIGDKLEFSSLKSQIYPKLKAFYAKSSSMQMKFKCLKCMGKLLENVDKWTVVEDLIPFLGKIRTQDSSIIMAIYGIFRIATYHKRLGFSADEIAQKVLPSILPLSVNTSLTMRQYKAFARLISALCVKLERLHEIKLEQSGSKADGLEMISVDESEGKEIHSSNEAMDEILSSYLKDHDKYDQEFSTKSPSSEKLKALTLEEKLNATSGLKCIEAAPTPVKELALTPFDAPALVRPTQPKDLTSTLINQNLNSLSANNNGPRAIGYYGSPANNNPSNLYMGHQPAPMMTSSPYQNFNTSFGVSSPMMTMQPVARPPTQQPAPISLSQKDIEDFLK